jgi:hypothetical protein
VGRHNREEGWVQLLRDAIRLEYTADVGRLNWGGLVLIVVVVVVLHLANLIPDSISAWKGREPHIGSYIIEVIVIIFLFVCVVILIGYEFFLRRRQSPLIAERIIKLT